MELSLDSILKANRSVKILITVVTLLVVAAAYVFLMFLPARTDVQQLDRRLSTLLSKKSEQEAIANNLSSFRAECRNLEAELRTAMAQLPNKKEIPTLLQNISNLARESGLEIPSFKPGGQTKRDFYAEVPVDIKLSGSFPRMLHFLYRVGALPRIVNVETLGVQRKGQADTEDQLEIMCKAVTYKFLEEAEREKTDKTNPKNKR